MSDHGFASFRKSVNYDTWLVLNGYMVLKTGVQSKERNLEMLFDQGQFWENVDWSKSRAYAMGLGDVYVNLRGRERDGLVAPGAEYDALRTELIARLTALADPVNGERAVSRVFKREDVYRRFDPRTIPDLIVTNTAGYRVSWQTTLGGSPPGIVYPNARKWSADHGGYDFAITAGVLISNRPANTPTPTTNPRTIEARR